MRSDERFLHQIQRLVSIANVSPDHPKNRLTMAAHDLGESGFSTRNAERRQLLLR